MKKMIDTVFEDEWLTVVVKPAGMAAVDDKTGDESLVAMLRAHYGTDYIEAVHRLDRPVGGIMIIARTKHAFAALSGQFAVQTVDKSYLAVVSGETASHGELLNYLIKNERLNISKVVPNNTKNAREARLAYETTASAEVDGGQLSLIKIKLFTGRHHQIRVQFQQAGHPLWGDTKYNPGFIRHRGFVHLGLWGAEVGFNHPITGERVKFSVPPHDKPPFSFFEPHFYTT